MDEMLLYWMTEIAHLLSLSRSKTYELVRAGHLRTVRVGGRLRVRGVM